MLETKTTQLQNPSSSSSSTATAALLAFKPRQVVLAQSSKSHPAAMAKKQQSQDKSLLLHQSILHYLHLNGFSKTLKRFLQETDIQGDSWKSCSLILEDIYSKYLNNCTNNDTNSKGNNESEQHEDGTNVKKINSSSVGSQKTISKKKKKKKSEDNNCNVPDASHPETVDKSTTDATNAQEVLADDKADTSLKKQKEKKKKKTEAKSEGVVPIGDDNNDTTEKATKKDKKKKSKEENEATDSKDSKKRKRLASDENVNQGVDVDGTEESKRRKTSSLEESKAAAEQGKSDALCTENGHAESGNQANSKGNHQDDLNNSAKQKSSRKETNGSAEPKTVNAFQRVKIEQVEFKDDRLKDNSYWAKDGADIGYGAKAQEVLGQVKGRDFRHEKTKKKRGSYRGGHIDLQSHSVKFNYSDEE